MIKRDFFDTWDSILHIKQVMSQKMYIEFNEKLLYVCFMELLKLHGTDSKRIS